MNYKITGYYLMLLISVFIAQWIVNFYKETRNDVYEKGYCQGKSEGWLEGRHPTLDIVNTQCNFEIGIGYPENYKFIKTKDFKREENGIYDCACEGIYSMERVECPNYIVKDWNKYCETANRYKK